MKTILPRLHICLVWLVLSMAVILPCAQTGAATATIYDAWWSNQTDSGGGCMVPTTGSNFRLNWDPDVVGGVGSLSVFEKVYFKQTSSSTWTLFTTTMAHTITGTGTSDQQYVDIPPGSNCSLWDYSIEVYRAGQPTPDYTLDPSNKSILAAHGERYAVEITFQFLGGNLSLSWDIGTLQAAEQLTGPWVSVPGATTSYSVVPSATRKFYRVQVH